MAFGSSDLSLLFRLKAENQASPAIKATQADIAKLTSTTSAQFGQMQAVTTRSLGLVTQNLTSLSSRIPVVGTAVSSLSSQFTAMAGTTAVAGGSLAALAGPAVLATAAVGGLVTGLIALGRAIFDLAVSTADYAGKLFDLSKQTNFTVETLSALSLAAKDSGGSIETISASLGIFQSNMVKAAEGNKTYAKTFRDLKIDTTDQEKALRQAMAALFAMGETEKQSAEAKRLFGRAGKEVLGVIKETNGNLDEATKKYAAMGRIITSEAAAAADAFEKSLNQLNDQLAGVGRTIGFEVIPILNVFFQDMSGGLTRSRGEWVTWAGLVKNEVAGVLAIAQTLADLVRTPGGLSIAGVANIPGQVLINQRSLLDRAALQSRLLSAFSVGDQAARLGRRPGSTETEDGSAAQKEAQQRANKEIALALQELEEITRVNRIALERERELDLKTIKEWEDESINAAQNRLAQQQIVFDQEKENIRQFIKNRQDQSLALREVDQKDEKAQNDFFIAVQKTRDDATKQRNQLDLALNRQLAEIRDATREGELQRIKEQLDRGIITESEAITRTLALLKEEQEQRLLLIDLELKQETTSAKRKEELDNDKIESEQRFTDAKKRLTEERIDAANREAAATAPGVGRGVPDELDDLLAGLGAKIEAEIGPPPALQQHIDVVGTLAGAYEDLAQGISRGIGSIIQNLVLFGKVGPDTFRKVLASALATVAAQAGAQAIYELALGIAALTPWGAAIYGPAVLHFKAAALLGSIAVGAGLIGRGVAGSVFSQEDGSGGVSGGGSPRGTSQTVNPIDLTRTQQREELHIFVHTEPGAGFPDAVINTFVRDVQRNGPTREVIIHTAGT